MTLLTTFLDFSDTGVLDLFIDEAHGAHARDDDRRAERGRRQPAQGPGAGDDLQLPAPERPGLELRRRQLPEGRDAAAVRPALLEQRRHQPARADVLLVPAQHLPREQPRPAGQGDGLRREGRPRQHRRADLPLRLARGPHRAVAGRLPQHAGAQGQAPLRARRVRPHRRRDQPAGRRRSAATGSARARRCRRARRTGWPTRRAPGQLVDRLVGLARAVRRQAGRRAEDARQRARTRRSSRRPAATSRRRPERA